MYVCTNACTHECIYVCIMCVCMYIKLLLGVHCGPVPVPSPGTGGWLVARCRYRRREKETNEIQWQAKKSEWKTPRCGRRRERCWTPTRAKAQDTRASPNSLETHLVRKTVRGHLRELSPWSNGWMDGMNICMFAFTEGGFVLVRGFCPGFMSGVFARGVCPFPRPAFPFSLCSI